MLTVCLTCYQTTNFRLLQTERVCRRQFQIWRKWQKVVQTGRKHYEKRRNCSLLAISPITQCFQDLTFPTNKPWFLRVCSTRLLKTLWEKEKLLIPSNFSLSHSVFYLFEELSAIFIRFEIVVCKLFLVWKSVKFVVLEMVNCSFDIHVYTRADFRLNQIKRKCS